jgi:hypothetical protein
MTDRKAPSAVGYKRPPKNTQWQKGQCGNPKRQYKRTVKGTIELIDVAFADQIDIVRTKRRGGSASLKPFSCSFGSKDIRRQARDSRATEVSGIRRRAEWPRRRRIHYQT